MKKRLIKLLMLCALTVSLLHLSPACNPMEDLTKIKVVLLETDGVKVLSRQSVEIKPGNDVEFKIKLADGYAYLGMTKNGEAVREEAGTPAKEFPIEGEYNEKNGTLKLKNVKYPSTVEVYAKPKSELYSFALVYNERMGGASIVGGTKLTKGYKYMPVEGGSVSLTAYAHEKYSFNGWSVGDYIENGGRVVSYDKDFEFIVEENTVLYANFSDIDASKYKVVYHLNGGKTKTDGKAEQEVLGDCNTQFEMQQTLISDGSFVRDGYVAVGYSTQAANYEAYGNVNKIPGFCNMGGIYEVPRSGVLALYVVWARETDSASFTFSDGRITKYNGDAEIVVIPEKINGTAVTEIAADAFKNKTSLARLVIPRTVKTLGDGAFAGCTSLNEVVFFDSLENVTDNAFKNCRKISTVTLNSQRLPRYSGSAEGSFCIKYERLKTLTGKKIIILGGSAVLHGIDSKTLETRMSGYSALNYGTSSDISLRFYLDVIANYVGANDRVVLSPEMNAYSMGSTAITAALFRASEQCYDIFREVDMTEYSGFWTAFGRFQKGEGTSPGAAAMTGKEYRLSCKELNAYGDWSLIKNAPTAQSFGDATAVLDKSLLNYQSINKANTRITEKGALLLISFAPRDLKRISEQQATKPNYNEFTKYFEDKLDAPVISNIGSYLLEHEYFYDTEYHCNADGVRCVTDLIIVDINRYLASPSAGAPVFSSTPDTVYSNTVQITYNANGGSVSSGGKIYRVTKERDEQFSMQQTLWSNGTFLRDGYVAVGYSTQPVSFEGFDTVNSIPGFSNMGGVCEVPKSSGTLTLYVVWAQETAGTHFEFSDGTVTKYTGNADTVVIPEYINGKAVTKIAAGAFKGKTALKRLVIPKSVITLEDGAFEGCTALKEVVFFDSVLNVTDNAFKGCNNITTVTLNSQRLPKYSGDPEGNSCIKYERLRTLTTKKIIVVSGSSSLYGLDSAAMEQSFPGYSVVNYGINIANCSLFFLDVISNYTIEGDIVIHAPEMGTNVMGDNYINPKLFRANTQCYDIFREVDMRDYRNFFTSFGYFQTGDPKDSSLAPAINLSGKDYQKHCNQLNKYGDIAMDKTRPNQDSPFGNARQGFNKNLLTAENAARLNAVNKKIKAKGGTLLMSFAPREIQCMNENYRTAAHYNDFTKDCEAKLDYAVISNVGTYLLDHEYFYNSEYHLTNQGAALRTQRLAEDLRRYLQNTASGAPML